MQKPAEEVKSTQIAIWASLRHSQNTVCVELELSFFGGHTVSTKQSKEMKISTNFNIDDTWRQTVGR